MNTVTKARATLERLFSPGTAVECPCGGAWYPGRAGGRITFAVHTDTCPRHREDPARHPRPRKRAG